MDGSGAYAGEAGLKRVWEYDDDEGEDSGRGDAMGEPMDAIMAVVAAGSAMTGLECVVSTNALHVSYLAWCFCATM